MNDYSVQVECFETQPKLNPFDVQRRYHRKLPFDSIPTGGQGIVDGCLFQFNQAGAQAVGLWGADGFTLTKSPGEAAAPTLEQAAFYLCPEVDILLTEGFKEAATPKILVLTPGQEDRLVTEVRGVILATVGPKPFKEEWPHFQTQEAGRLVEMLEQRFLKVRREPRIRVWLDGKRIPMKDFVQDIIIQGIMGMLGTLRGFIPAGRVDITLSPRETSAEGKLRKDD